MGKVLSNKQVIANKYQRNLIKHATNAEQKFKRLLHLSKLKPKFEFQKQWIQDEAFFISDFYFPASNYTIELDGGYHNTKLQKRKDSRKSKYLRSMYGVKTLRITNKKVLWMSIEDLDKLLKKHKIA